MAINFPSAPILDQIFTSGNTSFIWNGSHWRGYYTSSAVNYSASSIEIRDDGSSVGAAGTIDFGENLSVSFASGITTITATSQFVTTAAGIHTLSNVGIGTTNPTSKLTVSGDASVNGITVGRGSISSSLGFSSAITNTAIGYSALYSNTTGYNNTAIGSSALYSNTTGNSNVAVGYISLENNTLGTENVAIGVSALNLNTTGSRNVAVGNDALQLNTTGDFNTVLGYASASFNTTGRANTAVGVGALYRNTTGTHNVAIGIGALQTNVSGWGNVGVGSQALYNNFAINNTAVGSLALTFNTTGTNNTAVGHGAINKSQTGDNNTAVGRSALQENTTGSDNVAIGVSALVSNLIGYSNIAIGKFALANCTTGYQNIAINAAGPISTGGTGGSGGSGGSEENCYYSGGYQSTFGCNIGDRIDSTFTFPNGVTLYNCTQKICSPGNAENPGNAAEEYPVFNVVDHNNRIVMGSTSATNAYIQIPWTVVSDSRDKTNFAPIPHGLNFVKQLKPISFQFRKNRELDEPYGQLRYGFLAQDILALEGSDSIIIDSEDPEKLRYNGESLIPVLVQSIQELAAKVDALQKEIEIINNK